MSNECKAYSSRMTYHSLPGKGRGPRLQLQEQIPNWGLDPFMHGLCGKTRVRSA